MATLRRSPEFLALEELLLSIDKQSSNVMVELINQQIEPRHEISNNVVCATSKGSYQPAHTCSLIRAFASRLNIL